MSINVAYSWYPFSPAQAFVIQLEAQRLDQMQVAAAPCIRIMLPVSGIPAEQKRHGTFICAWL
jgi:hypothetical protein